MLYMYVCMYRSNLIYTSCSFLQPILHLAILFLRKVLPVSYFLGLEMDLLSSIVAMDHLSGDAQQADQYLQQPPTIHIRPMTTTTTIPLPGSSELFTAVVSWWDQECRH
jgi:hypothetical protein